MCSVNAQSKKISLTLQFPSQMNSFYQFPVYSFRGILRIYKYMCIYIFIYKENTLFYASSFFIRQYICDEKIFSASEYQYILHISAHRAALSFLMVT